MDKIKCCNEYLKLKSKDGYHCYVCQTCNKKGVGKTEKEAIDKFHESSSSINALTEIPKNSNGLMVWANNNMPALLRDSAQFIDKPATKRMIEKNIRYISTHTGLTKVWESKEGRESINHALSESLYYAAIMPQMGSIVPFGKTAEFVPAVECFKFALETGKNAPLKDINILLIHENDQRKTTIKEGNFSIEIDIGIPRGDIIAVVVYATRDDTKKQIGEVYDVERLMKKAEHHSPSYRSYLIEKEDFNRQKTEGKLKKDSTGREYLEKKIEYMKDGQKKTWDKKIYEHDIINPYDGPDRPEMLRKSAGKSFLAPYMKTRNASAMATEWDEDKNLNSDNDIDKAADNVLKNAAKQFGDMDESKIEDAEIVEESQKSNSSLFDDIDKKNQGA